jgi:signal transduction histidine kinase
MTTQGPAGPATVRALDVALALLVSVLVLIGAGVSLEDDFEISLSGHVRSWLPDATGIALLLAGTLPLVLRRVAPLTVLGTSVMATLAYQALGYRVEPLPLGVLVALYTVALVRSPLICSAAAGVYLMALTVGALTGWLPLTDDQYYIDLVSVVATVMLGYGVALGRTRATLAEQRAAALTRHQEDLLRAAMRQEQARIAREVHDIVAHDVSVIVAQAAAARLVLAARPEKAVDALSSIEAVGRDALDGLRRLVGLLRTQHDECDRDPQPCLERLPWLLSQVERAGLPVDLTIEGEPAPLPATVELNAYRIVQEALTNTLKHAGPTHASVTLAYEPASLRVEVRDEGGRNATHERERTQPGYGLISMQQRAAMLGGDLVIEPGGGRGFRVAARLPVAGASR